MGNVLVWYGRHVTAKKSRYFDTRYSVSNDLVNPLRLSLHVERLKLTLKFLRLKAYTQIFHAPSEMKNIFRKPRTKCQSSFTPL